MDIKAEIKTCIDPLVGMADEYYVGKEYPPEELKSYERMHDDYVNKLADLFAKYEAEIRKDEREKVLRQVLLELNPAEFVDARNPDDVLIDDIGFANKVDRLKDQSLTNKGE